MNILYVTDEVQVSGATTFQLGFIPELEKKRHKVDLFLFADPNKKPVQSYQHLCHAYIRHEISNHFSKKSLVSRFFILKKFIEVHGRAQKYDLWIVDMPHGLMPLALVKALTRSTTPIIFIFHGSNVLQETDSVQHFHFKSLSQVFFKKLESYFYNQTQRIFVFSQFSKDVLIQMMQIPSEKVKIAYPGIDPLFAKTAKTYSRKKAREKLGLSASHKLFVIAGRVEPRKGIVPALKAFTSLRNGSPTTMAMLSNFSEVHDDIFTEVESNNDESKQIIFIHKPSREKIALFFRAADCVILPSVAWETLGYVTLEALATNTPVVAFSIGANEELLNQGQIVNFKNTDKNFVELIHKANLQKINTPLKSIQRFNWKTYIETFFANI